MFHFDTMKRPWSWRTRSHSTQSRIIVVFDSPLKFSVPINSPVNLTAYNVSSREIEVSWDYNEDPRLVLGNLQGFVLYILEANANDFFPDDAILRTYYTDTRRRTRVRGLEIFRLYNISVAARTTKGDGPRNDSVIVRTHGEGKWTVTR